MPSDRCRRTTGGWASTREADGSTRLPLLLLPLPEGAIDSSPSSDRGCVESMAAVMRLG